MKKKVVGVTFLSFFFSEKVENRKVVHSNEFWVYTNKLYPGPIESTFLSRTFADQGIKMRIRKNLGYTEELKRYKMDIKRKFNFFYNK